MNTVSWIVVLIARIYLMLVSMFYILVGLGGILFSPFPIPTNPLSDTFVYIGLLGSILGIAPLSLAKYLGPHALTIMGVGAMVLGLTSFVSVVAYYSTHRKRFLFTLCTLTTILSIMVFIDLLSNFNVFPICLVVSFWLAIYVLHRGVSSEQQNLGTNQLP